MSAAYAAASSYEDRGSVTTVYSGNSPHTDKLSFETAFVRGRRFRFEYRRGHELRGRVYTIWNDLTIWSDFDHTYSEWTVRPGIVDDGPDLGLALGAAAGVSGGSSITIARMLLPDVLRRGDGVLRLHAPTVDGAEVVDGHPCWRVKGENRGDPVTLWVDRDSHLLRRLQTSNHFASFDTVDTMAFAPVINQPVAEARLQPPDIAASPPFPREPLPPSPWIGIMFESGTTKITNVIPGAPGDQAGLLAGDEIVAVAGRPVIRTSEVVAEVFGRAIGERVVITVTRGASKLDVPVTLGEHKP